MSNYPTPDQPSLTDGVNPPCEHGVDRSYFRCPACEADEGYSLTANDLTYQHYGVSVSNYFDATSAEDAISQMATWLIDNAYRASYRVDRYEGDDLGSEPVETWRIDAEGIDWHETRLS